MLGGMNAAILKAFGLPLVIEAVPDPVLGTGEVIVDMVAAPVLSYANEVFSGERQYLLKLPVVPGAGGIGRVRAYGPDATHLKIGDWVFCDPTIRSRDDVLSPDITLQGLSARGEGGLRLQDYFGNGAYAQQVRLPTENVLRLGEITDAEAEQWCALNTVLVPYSGLRAMNLQAGETVLISGATGNFGSSGVAAALAMGAGCVIAPGRNEGVLADLERRFGGRVRTVKLSGDEAADRQRMQQAAPGPIDGVLDILPPSASPAAVRAAAMAVRPGGQVVLMGGVGMLGGEALNLPYPWIMRNNITVRGQWMYTPDVAVRLVSLIRSGLLRLSEFDVTAFALADINAAVTHAAEVSGAFKLTVIRP